MAEPSLVGAISDGRRVPAVTVFGWDDVLCPTTHAKLERNRRAESRQERIQLLNVGQSVVRLVRAAQRHGPVVIVTDSHEGWVRGTAELLLPGGAAAACLENVEVVSSRDRFAKDFPDQPACWQIAAFSYVTNRHLLSRGATDRFRRANAAAANAAAAAAAAASRGGVEGGRNRGTAQRESAGGGGGDGETVEKREGGADVGTAGCATAAAAASASSGGAGAGRVAGASRRRRHRRRVSFGSGSGSGSSGGGGSRGDGGDVRVSTRGSGTLIAVATAPKHSEDKAAALTLREHHPNVVAKTVSLMEGPTPLELKNQVDLLADKFKLMFGHTSPVRRDSAPAPAAAAEAAASMRAPVVSSPEVRRREGGGSLSDDDDDDDDDFTSDDDDDDGRLLLLQRGAPAPSCGSSTTAAAAAAAAAESAAAATPPSGLPSAFQGDAVKPGRLKTGTLEQGRHISGWGYGDGDSDDYMTPPCSASTVSSNSSHTGSVSAGG
ncbi:unnamed protein product, partial [Ectocarpus fasciculatus]